MKLMTLMSSPTAESTAPRLTKLVVSLGLTLSLGMGLIGCQQLASKQASLRPADPVPLAGIPAAYPVEAPRSSTEAVRAGAAEASDRLPSIAEQDWQQFFAPDSLKTLIRMGLDSSRDLRATVLTLEKVREQYQITQNSNLPTVMANAGVARQHSNGQTGNQYSVGVGVTAWELDLFGKIASLKDQALQTFLATEQAGLAAQNTLIAQIAQIWLAYHYDQHRLSLAENTLKAQQAIYSLNQKKFAIGVINEVTVRQSQISVETAASDIATLRSQLSLDRQALALLIGQPVPDALLPKAGGQPQPIATLAELPPGLPSDVLQRRPDLRQSEYLLKAAGANIAAARARLYPSISLTGKAGLASAKLSDLFSSGSFFWSIGPSIDLPIFDAHNRESAVRIAEIDQQLALNTYEKSIQTAFREVSDALAVQATLDDRLQAQQRMVEATRVNYRLSNARFKAGIDSYLTVLDAQRSQYAAEQALLSLQQSREQNQLTLYKVLGGGVAQPVMNQQTQMGVPNQPVEPNGQAEITPETHTVYATEPGTYLPLGNALRDVSRPLPSVSYTLMLENFP